MTDEFNSKINLDVVNDFSIEDLINCENKNLKELKEIDEKIFNYIENFIIYLNSLNSKIKFIWIRKFFNKLIAIIKNFDDNLLFFIDKNWINKFKNFLNNKEIKMDIQKIDNNEIKDKIIKKENINNLCLTVNKFLFYSVYFIFGGGPLLFSYKVKDNYNKNFLYNLTKGNLKEYDKIKCININETKINIKFFDEKINKIVSDFFLKKPLNTSTSKNTSNYDYSDKLFNKFSLKNFSTNKLCIQQKSTSNTSKLSNILSKNYFFSNSGNNDIKYKFEYKSSTKDKNLFLLNYLNFDKINQTKINDFIEKKSNESINFFKKENNFINFDINFHNINSKIYFSRIDYNILICNVNMMNFLKLEKFKDDKFIQNLLIDIRKIDYFIFPNINCKFLDKNFSDENFYFFDLLKYINKNYQEINNDNISEYSNSKNYELIITYLKEWNTIKNEYFSQKIIENLCLGCMNVFQIIKEKLFIELKIIKNINLSFWLDFYFKPKLINNGKCLNCFKKKFIKKNYFSILPNFLIFKFKYLKNNLQLNLDIECYKFNNSNYILSIIITYSNEIFLREKNNKWLKIDNYEKKLILTINQLVLDIKYIIFLYNNQ